MDSSVSSWRSRSKTPYLTELQKSDPSHEYDLNDTVGKLGIEKSLESELQGTKGSETIFVNSMGKVTETTDYVEPVAGNDVYLTLDSNLQKYCYDTLEDEITSIILTYLTPAYNVVAKENASIAITDVYFGLFNNNIFSLDHMKSEDATATEKNIITAIESQQEATLDSIDRIQGMNITFVTTANTDEEGYALLKAFGLPFKNAKND